MREPEDDSVRLALDKTWQDHQHTRNQTWTSLQIVAILIAGLIGLDWGKENHLLTVGVGILVMLAAFFGCQITIRHREVECMKFKFIGSYEKQLHLDEIIGEQKVPEKISFLNAFKFSEHNTSLFILRMHITIIIFAGSIVVNRLLKLFT